MAVPFRVRIDRLTGRSISPVASSNFQHTSMLSPATPIMEKSTNLHTASVHVNRNGMGMGRWVICGLEMRNCFTNNCCFIA